MDVIHLVPHDQDDRHALTARIRQGTSTKSAAASIAQVVAIEMADRAGKPGLPPRLAEPSAIGEGPIEPARLDASVPLSPTAWIAP
jgi:hypothetical protein